MTYTNLNAEDLRGSTVADYLIGIEADFEIRDGDQLIYEEPYFPVVELARGLNAWLQRHEDQDFVFDSLSFDEPGAVTIARLEHGWVFGSIFSPAQRSSVLHWSAVEECVGAFIAKVRADLVSLGVDPVSTIGE